jgi:hypothetical protein
MPICHPMIPTRGTCLRKGASQLDRGPFRTYLKLPLFRITLNIPLYTPYTPSTPHFLNHLRSHKQFQPSRLSLKSLTGSSKQRSHLQDRCNTTAALLHCFGPSVNGGSVVSYASSSSPSSTVTSHWLLFLVVLLRCPLSNDFPVSNDSPFGSS